VLSEAPDPGYNYHSKSKATLLSRLYAFRSISDFALLFNPATCINKAKDRERRQELCEFRKIHLAGMGSTG
jgi:hypothetical protein